MGAEIEGLQYNVNLGGNVDAQLQATLAKIKEVKAALDGLGSSAKTTAVKAPRATDTTSQNKKAQESITKLSQDELRVQHKILTARKKVTQQNKEAARISQRAQKAERAHIAAVARADKARRAAFDRETTATAQQRNKEATQSADKKALANSKALKADMIERARIADTMKPITAEDANAQATQKNLQASNALAVKRAQINQLVEKGNITHRAAAEQVGVSAAQAKKLGLNMWDAQHAARQFLFTFRRLVGILALFTLARKLAQGIGAAVGQMVSFNAELESAEIGIASIVTSIGQIRDGTGKLLTGAAAFNVAMSESRGIVKQLQKDALGSIATFQALVQSYQVAVGPGLAAGLDLDQIREVSKRLTEGALSLGVPLNQLSEEIRSLLQGTATAKNTRIAVLFGGAKEANEAIRNAKEQGNLYETLTAKFGGIALGADAAALSMNVLKSNLQDTVQILLAQGGIEQFNAVKDSVLALSQAIKTTDAEGTPIFAPEALGIVQEIAGTLAGITLSFREISDTGQVLVLVRNVLATVGDVLKVIAPLATAVFQGLVTGANNAIAPLRIVADSVRAIARVLSPDGVITKALAITVKWLVAGVTTLVLWVKLTKTLAFLWGAKGILFSTQKIGMAIAAINRALLTVIGTQRAAAVATFVVRLQTQGWAVAMAGVSAQVLIVGGLLVVLSAALAFLITKTKLWENSIGRANKELKKTSKEADSLNNIIEGADSSWEDSNETLKDITKQIKTIAEETAKIRFLDPVTGDAKKLVEVEYDRVKALMDATKQEQISIANAKEEVVLLRKRNEEILTGIRVVGQSPPRRGRDEVGDLALERAGVLAEEARALVRISVAEDKIAQRTSSVNALFSKTLEQTLTTLDSKEKIDQLDKDTVASADKLTAAKLAQTSQAGADVILAQLKIKLLDQQLAINERDAQANADSLTAQKQAVQDTADELRGAGGSIQGLQAEIDTLKAPEIISVEQARKALRKIDAQIVKASLFTGQAGGLNTGTSSRTKALQAESVKLEKDIIAAQNAGSATLFAGAQQRFALDKGILESKLAVAEANAKTEKEAVDAVVQLQDQMDRDAVRTENEKNKLMAKRVKAQAKVDRASLEASENIIDGMMLGVLEFNEELETGARIFADLIKEGLEGVSNSFGSTFREYLETGDTDQLGEFFRNALWDVFLDLAETFATKVSEQLIGALAETVIGQSASNLFGGVGGSLLGTSDIAGDSGGESQGLISKGVGSVFGNAEAGQEGILGKAMTAMTAALGLSTAADVANTTATTSDALATSTNAAAATANTGAKVAETAATATNTAGLVANSASTNLNTASVWSLISGMLINAVIWAANTAASIASTIATWALVVVTAVTGFFGNKGGLVPKTFDKGGKVPQGLAGGGVPLSAPFSRPSNIPASDTVPAWLTPGEFVITRDMVKQVGVNALERWRTGMNPPSFQQAGSSMKRSASAVRGFATGGAVGRGSADESSSDRPVNVAFFDDRKAMSRWAETTEGETAILKVLKQNAHRFA